jgi:hypothetical protein
VVNSKSYKEIGSYNYPTTPNQALKYLKWLIQPTSLVGQNYIYEYCQN